LVNTPFDISSYLQRLDLLGEAEVLDLTEAIKEKPWCSSYRMLLARAYANQNSYLKNKTLRVAAAYSGSREQLFELMHSPAVSYEPLQKDNEDRGVQEMVALQESSSRDNYADKEPEIAMEVVEAEIPEITANTIELDIPAEHKVAAQPEGDAIKATEEVVETVENQSFTSHEEELTLANEGVTELPQDSHTDTILASQNEDDTEVLPNEKTPQVNVENKVEPIEENDIPEEAEIAEEHVAVTDNHKTSIDFEKIVTYDPAKELVPAEPKESRRVELPFDTVIYDPEKELSRLIEEQENHHSKEHDFLYWLNHVEQDDQVRAKSKENFKSPDRVQELLDQFLATKRTKPLKNAKFYKATEKAEESVQDNMDVLSETLIELYVKQGHLDKAKLAYQKLSLQIPSKSAYFAARIKQIEQQQKEL
jgi:hypothetical protein